MHQSTFPVSISFFNLTWVSIEIKVPSAFAITNGSMFLERTGIRLGNNICWTCWGNNIWVTENMIVFFFLQNLILNCGCCIHLTFHDMCIEFLKRWWGDIMTYGIVIPVCKYSMQIHHAQYLRFYPENSSLINAIPISSSNFTVLETFSDSFFDHSLQIFWNTWKQSIAFQWKLLDWDNKNGL